MCGSGTSRRTWRSRSGGGGTETRSSARRAGAAAAGGSAVAAGAPVARAACSRRIRSASASRVTAEKSWLARSSPSIASFAYRVSPPYSAAMRVAVNFFVSAAPPTNSGMSIPATRRSWAVTTICCADFTSSPESPKASGLWAR